MVKMTDFFDDYFELFLTIQKWPILFPEYESGRCPDFYFITISTPFKQKFWNI